MARAAGGWNGDSQTLYMHAERQHPLLRGRPRLDSQACAGFTAPFGLAEAVMPFVRNTIVFFLSESGNPGNPTFSRRNVRRIE
jgi:hypothetical protein